MTPESSNEELQVLYRELVLDHARSPRNFGRLPDPTHCADGINPLCGDKLSVYVRVGDGGTLADVRFEGSGCAISIASASLMTETVRKLTTERASECAASVNKRLTTGEEPDIHMHDIDTTRLQALDGIRKHPTRIKCATLAWSALRAALEQSTTNVTTE